MGFSHHIVIYFDTIYIGVLIKETQGLRVTGVSGVPYS